MSVGSQHDDGGSDADIRRNCSRLVEAYGASVSSITGRIARVISPVSPSWAKVNRVQALSSSSSSSSLSSLPPSLPSSTSSSSSSSLPSAGPAAAMRACRSCDAPFTAFRRRESCAICGLPHFCARCVFRSALLYLDATGKARITVLTPDARLPPRSAVVEACAGCLDYVEASVAARSRPEGAAMWDELLPVDAVLRDTAARVDAQLAEFRSLTDSLRPDGPSVAVPGRGLVPRIAKHQSDLERLTEQLRGDLARLRELTPTSRTFEALVGAMARARATFLRETASSLREIERALETLLPPEVLAVVADAVNRDSLTAATILSTQLAVESSLLGSKELTLALDGVAAKVRAELEPLVVKGGGGREAWDRELDKLTRAICANGQDKPLLRHLATLPAGRARMQAKVVAVLHRLRSQLEYRATMRAIAGVLEAVDAAAADVPGQVIAADADAEGWEVL